MGGTPIFHYLPSLAVIKVLLGIKSPRGINYGFSDDLTRSVNLTPLVFWDGKLHSTKPTLLFRLTSPIEDRSFKRVSRISNGAIWLFIARRRAERNRRPADHNVSTTFRRVAAGCHGFCARRKQAVNAPSA